MPVMTGLSGNEIWCLTKKGLAPGDLIVGNSVFSMGVIGSFGSSFRTFLGGEVKQVTDLVHEGRANAYARLATEAGRRGGVGVTGVSNELVFLNGNIEFLSVGSTIHASDHGGENVAFTSSSNGQELYCQIDAGYRPVKFVFGNVAYSVGVGGGLFGGLRSLKRGEVKEYSDVFNYTRHLALERITEEAKSAGANCVLGIKTSIIPFKGMQEMVMLGTASHHDAYPEMFRTRPATSDLTCLETWNLAKMGYMPLKLVLGVSVYSLGLAGRIKSWFQALSRGEITDYTHLIYEARENAVQKIANDAQALGADDVAGIKTYVYDLGGGLIEFMAIGTAVKRVPELATRSAQLPCQAVISDRDTFINTAEAQLSSSLDSGSKGASNASEMTGNATGLLKLLFDLLR